MWLSSILILFALCVICGFVWLVGVQWFGVDIGGTLTKGVYFECHTPNDKQEGEGVLALQNYVKSNLTYGSSGNRLVICVCVCVCVHACVRARVCVCLHTLNHC